MPAIKVNDDGTFDVDMMYHLTHPGVNRSDEYEICLKRGHTAGNYRRGDGFVQCRWCLTYYRYDTILKEDGIPDGHN